ncbi:MAG: TonB-dependent receptor [Myxococcales bacterium]|jgi:Fe(3+) dicitrate transport protein
MRLFLLMLIGVLVGSAPVFAQDGRGDEDAHEDVAASETEAGAESETESGSEPDESAYDDVEVVLVLGEEVARAPGSVHVLGSEELERFEYDDPHAALLQVPGVYVRQEDGLGLRPNLGLRGVNADRSKKVTLMEDGVLFGPAPYSAPAAYYFPVLTRMTELRVLKGPSAIAYGPQTVGGAVDFSTREIPALTDGRLDLSYGQRGQAKLHGYFGSSTDQSGFLVEGVHLHNDGFKELPDGANTGFTRNEWMLKAFHMIDPNAQVTQEIRLKLTYSDEVSNETYLGLTDADFDADPYRRYLASSLDQMKNHRTSIVLTHLLATADQSLHLTTRAYRHDYRRVWRKLAGLRGFSLPAVLRSPDDLAYSEALAVIRGEVDSATAAETLLIGPNDRTFVSQGLQSVLQWQTDTGALSHSVELGARLHYDSIRRQHERDGYVVRDGDLFPEGTPTLVAVANEDSTVALALHALDAMRIADLTLTPGVRMELLRSEHDDLLTGETTQRDLLTLMPGLGAYYALIDGLGVLAGAYRGFSPPAPGSDDSVAPEESWNFEAGARFTRDDTHLELIGFYNAYKNLTDVCTAASGCLDDNLDRQFDAGRAHVYGFEAYAMHELSAGPLDVPLTLAYTFTRGKFDSSFTSSDPIYGDVERGDEVPYLPRHQLNGNVAVESDTASGFASATYVAAMREEAGRGSLDATLATDEQFWIDLGLSLRPIEHLELYAQLRNVLDAAFIVSHRPYGARPNAPRWLQVGAKLQL